MGGMPKCRFRKGTPAPIYVALHNGKATNMATRHLTRGIMEFLDIVGSALAVSAATREHRPAREADLRRLGIDPVQFRDIERF